MSRRLLVLGWHNIDPTPFYPADPGAGRRGFERQLAAIDRLGTVVPLSEAVDTLAAGGELPPRAVALTFDDGYADWLDAAVPALDRRGMHGTFFLVSDILSGRIGAWWEELADAFDRVTAPSLEWAGRTHDLSTPAARRAAQDALKDELKLVDRATRVEAVARIAERIAPPRRRVRRCSSTGTARGPSRRPGTASGRTPSPTRSCPARTRAPSATSSPRRAAPSRRAWGRPSTCSPTPTATPATTTSGRCTSRAVRATARRSPPVPGLVGPNEPPFAMHRIVLTPLTDVGELFGKVARKGTGVARRVADRAVRSLTPTS